MSNATATHTLHIDAAADDTLTAWQSVAFEDIDADWAEAIIGDEASARDIIEHHVSGGGPAAGVDTFFRVRVVGREDGSEWISDTVWAAGEAHEDADDIAWEVAEAAMREGRTDVDVSVVEWVGSASGRTITIGDEIQIRVFNGSDEHQRPWAGYDVLVDEKDVNADHSWIETAAELRERLAKLIAG